MRPSGSASAVRTEPEPFFLIAASRRSGAYATPSSAGRPRRRARPRRKRRPSARRSERERGPLHGREAIGAGAADDESRGDPLEHDRSHARPLVDERERRRPDPIRRLEEQRDAVVASLADMTTFREPRPCRPPTARPDRPSRPSSPPPPTTTASTRPRTHAVATTRRARLASLIVPSTRPLSRSTKRSEVGSPRVSRHPAAATNRVRSGLRLQAWAK